VTFPAGSLGFLFELTASKCSLQRLERLVFCAILHTFLIFFQELFLYGQIQTLFNSMRMFNGLYAYDLRTWFLIVQLFAVVCAHFMACKFPWNTPEKSLKALSTAAGIKISASRRFYPISNPQSPISILSSPISQIFRISQSLQSLISKSLNLCKSLKSPNLRNLQSPISAISPSPNPLISAIRLGGTSFFQFKKRIHIHNKLRNATKLWSMR